MRLMSLHYNKFIGFVITLLATVRPKHLPVQAWSRSASARTLSGDVRRRALRTRMACAFPASGGSGMRSLGGHLPSVPHRRGLRSGAAQDRRGVSVLVDKKPCPHLIDHHVDACGQDQHSRDRLRPAQQRQHLLA
jgi:hypothetical protein